MCWQVLAYRIDEMFFWIGDMGVGAPIKGQQMLPPAH